MRKATLLVIVAVLVAAFSACHFGRGVKGSGNLKTEKRDLAAFKAIDTTVCPLYLLTGEYDFSCTPEDTLRTAGHIPGVEVTIMKEVGHFPMSENPAKFREYILPVLQKIS